MTEPDPDFDADLGRLWTAPTISGAAIGFLVLLVAWPLTRLRRRRHRQP